MTPYGETATIGSSNYCLHCYKWQLLVTRRETISLANFSLLAVPSPTMETAVLLENDPLTTRPSPSRSPLHRTVRIPSERSDDPGRNQDGKSTPNLPSSLHMITPWSTLGRGPLKRLFSNESNDALMSMITSSMRSTIELPIFRARAETQPSLVVIPLSLNAFSRN